MGTGTAAARHQQRAEVSPVAWRWILVSKPASPDFAQEQRQPLRSALSALIDTDNPRIRPVLARRVDCQQPQNKSKTDRAVATQVRNLGYEFFSVKTASSIAPSPQLSEIVIFRSFGLLYSTSERFFVRRTNVVTSADTGSYGAKQLRIACNNIYCT